jgi:hypothetical protein
MFYVKLKGLLRFALAKAISYKSQGKVLKSIAKAMP